MKITKILFLTVLGATTSHAMEQPKEQKTVLGKQLLKAASEGDYGRVHDLIVQGADIDYSDGKGCTALIQAVKSARTGGLRGNMTMDDYKKCIRLLIDAPAKSNDNLTPLRQIPQVVAYVNRQNKAGWTALMWAVQSGFGHESMLLGAGANVYLANKAGWTAWEWVIFPATYELLADKMVRATDEHRKRIYAFLGCLAKNFERGTYRNLCHVFKPHLIAQIRELSPYEKINKLVSPKVKSELLQKYFPDDIRAAFAQVSLLGKLHGIRDPDNENN